VREVHGATAVRSRGRRRLSRRAVLRPASSSPDRFSLRRIGASELLDVHGWDGTTACKGRQARRRRPALPEPRPTQLVRCTKEKAPGLATGRLFQMVRGNDSGLCTGPTWVLSAPPPRGASTALSHPSGKLTVLMVSGLIVPRT
jgi:hypothetical protein